MPKALHFDIPANAKECTLHSKQSRLYLTKLQKLFWPADGLTKRDLLLLYYASIAKVLLPHLRNRAMVMKRLAPRLVVEVEFDHFSGHRFRHGTKFLRRRPDKKPEKCTVTRVAFENSAPLPLLKAMATG